MKPNRNLLIAGVALLGIGALLFWGYKASSAPLPEGFPAPTPDGDIEVKRYPAYRAATVQVSGSLSQASSRGFSPLFRHISDNNISMTAPVETRYPAGTLQENAPAAGDAAVSFLYRSLDIVPQEVAENVQIEDVPAMTVVSIGIKGGYGYGVYAQGIEQLQGWLAQHPEYVVAGPPRRFFYDGPFVPDGMKRSDIQIPVELR